MTKSGVVRKLREEGNQKPRLRTPVPKGKSLVGLAAAFAEGIGLPLLPWQHEVFDQTLRVDGKGKWAQTEACVVVARQQGKSHLIRIRILLGLFVFGEKSIVLTAQDRQLARESFRLVAETIQANPMLAAELKVIRWANGQEEITLKSGQRVRIVAPTPSAARGYSNDLVIIDELREQEDFDLWAAIRPTINTRRNATEHGPQVYMASNAGHSGSVLLNQKREQALEAIAKGKPTGLAYLEWSVDETADIDDETQWGKANPALGKLIDLAAIRDLRKSMPEAVFRTEQLCQFVDSMSSFLPYGIWEKCFSESAVIPDAAKGTELFFGVDRAPSWEHATVVAVWKNGNQYWVEVVREWSEGCTPTAMLDFLGGLVERWQPRKIAGDDYFLNEVFDKLHRATGYEIHRVRGVDHSRAALALYSAAVSNEIRHNGDELLADHINAAEKRDIGEAWRLSRKHSSRHIDAAVALACAIHAASLEEVAVLDIPDIGG